MPCVFRGHCNTVRWIGTVHSRPGVFFSPTRIPACRARSLAPTLVSPVLAPTPGLGPVPTPITPCRRKPSPRDQLCRGGSTEYVPQEAAPTAAQPNVWRQERGEEGTCPVTLAARSAALRHRSERFLRLPHQGECEPDRREPPGLRLTASMGLCYCAAVVYAPRKRLVARCSSMHLRYFQPRPRTSNTPPS